MAPCGGTPDQTGLWEKSKKEWSQQLRLLTAQPEPDAGPRATCINSCNIHNSPSDWRELPPTLQMGKSQWEKYLRASEQYATPD